MKLNELLELRDTLTRILCRAGISGIDQQNWRQNEQVIEVENGIIIWIPKTN
jgi:hypothetical protein